MTATTGITRDEAISLIEAATSPASLFGHLTGADAQREYRRLARLVHPDASPAHASPAHASSAGTSPAGTSSAGASKRAAGAFAKLSALWQQRGGSSALAATGDIANLTRLPAQIRVPGRLLKLARDPADGDLIAREAAALHWLAREGDKGYLPYVPVLAGTRRYVDPATGITRRANVLDELTGFVGLDVVQRRFPDGLDPRDVAWIWRRVLVAIGFARGTGLVHGAVLPPHVMIDIARHGVVLIDWCYSTGGPNPGNLPAVVARYRDWYPPELAAGYAPGPDLDIYLATKSMLTLIAKPVPGPLAAFAAGCTLASPPRRPRDAWQLLREFDDLIERLWGPRKFRPFPEI